MVAIAFGSNSALVTSTAGSVTPSLPSGTAAGDLLLMHVAHGGTATMSAPSGWALATSVQISTTHRVHVFWRFAESGESAPTFTSSVTTNGMWGVLSRWTGVPVSADPFNSGGTPSGATATSSSMAGASMTPTVAGCMAVWFWTQGDNNTTSSVNNSATVAYNGSSYSSIVGIDSCKGAAYKLMATATSTGATTMTSSGSTAYGAISLLLDPTDPVVIKSGGDSGTGSESGGVVSTVTGGDTGTGSESGERGELKEGGDSGTGSESGSVERQSAGTDTGTGSESGGTAGTVTGTDTGTGTETGGTIGTLTGGDLSGVGSEFGHIAIPGGDTGTGSEQIHSLFGTVTGGDTGTGSEGGYVETLWGDLVIAVWGVHPTTGALIPLPDFTSFTASRERNGPGSISIDYPVDGLNFDLLRNTITTDRDLEVEIWWIGNDTGAARGFLQEASGDDVTEDRVWTFAGGFGELLINEAITFPAEIITTVTVTTTVKNSDTDYTVTKKITVSTPSSPPVTNTVVTHVESASEGTDTTTEQTNGDLIYTDVTPGELANHLIDSSQDRGGLLDLERGFTDTHDSAGRPWDKTISTKFSPGAPYDQVLGRLVEFAMAEWAVVWTGTAFRLELWAPEGRGVDRTQGLRPTILRRARNLVDAPRKWSVRDSGTTVLAAGSEGVYRDATDNDALTRRGRRIERSTSANNLSDPDVVLAYAQNQLHLIVEGTLEVTHGIAFLPGEPRPVIAFDIGDWVYSQTTAGLERLRVVQWTLTVGADRSGTVTLNDTLTDALTRVAAQLKAIAAGDTVVGTSESSGSQDLSTPMPPEITGASSIAFIDGTRGMRAAVTVGWIPPTVNVDGSIITDLAGYTVQFAMASSADAFNAAATVNNAGAESAVFDAPAGQTILIRVQAFDRNGNTSAWSDPPYPYTTETDDFPPPIPSAPEVSEYLGTVKISWDGLTVDGTNMHTAAADFDHVEVHMSTGSLFTPSDATLLGVLYGRGSMVATDLPYTVTQFARLVAVDWSNNKSDPSGQGSATPGPVVSADVFDGAIGTSKLADLAVTTAKINDLAVNNAKIGDLSVGKLTSGTMSAAVLLAGSIKTDTVGTRVEIGSFGIKLFNGANTMVDFSTATGSALVVGEFRTALTGQRVVFNPGGALPDTLNFYPNGAGDFARIMARTAPGDGTAAILIDGGAANGTARGRIGAYKSEAFISHVTNDAGGDTSAGYSRTAVSASTNTVLSWVQTTFDIDKYNGNTRLSASRFSFKWTNGEAGGNVPTLVSENNSGIKLDAGAVAAVNSAGSGYVPLLATSYPGPSSRALKRNIRAIQDDVFAVVRAVDSQQWRYRAAVSGDKRLHYGPIAEDIAAAMPGLATVELGLLTLDTRDLVGVTWAVLHRLLNVLPDWLLRGESGPPPQEES